MYYLVYKLFHWFDVLTIKICQNTIFYSISFFYAIQKKGKKSTILMQKAVLKIEKEMYFTYVIAIF